MSAPPPMRNKPDRRPIEFLDIPLGEKPTRGERVWRWLFEPRPALPGEWLVFGFVNGLWCGVGLWAMFG